MFWFLGPKAHGVLAPGAGIKPVPTTPPFLLTLEGEVSTPRPPGKSFYFIYSMYVNPKLLIYPSPSPFPSGNH